VQNFKKVVEKLKNYFSETVDEIQNKVTWPPYSELQSSAILVIVASLIFALFVGLMDVVFEKSMTFFYQSF
jgi:preprotein translocase subunit SecE